MENELLTFEVRFLRAQLSARDAEHELSAAHLRSRLEESEHYAAQLRIRLAEAESAEQDLVLLLRRLRNSPLGWFLRHKQNIRNLEQRYLGTDA
jgi:hypothetical protein